MFPIYPHSKHKQPLPLSTFCHQSNTFVTLDESIYIDTSLSPKVHSLSCLHSCYCTVMNLYKYIMTYIYHYNIIQSIFTTHKMLCALCLFIYLLQLLVTNALLIISIILPFPDVIKLESCNMYHFHIGFFHLIIFI